MPPSLRRPFLLQLRHPLRHLQLFLPVLPKGLQVCVSVCTNEVIARVGDIHVCTHVRHVVRHVVLFGVPCVTGCTHEV